MEEVAQLRKVKNGWVACDSYGDVVAVATSDEQLADLIGITLEQQKQAFFCGTRELAYDLSAMRHIMNDVRNCRKIDAIKAIRHVFKVNDGGTEVRMGLKDAKDLIELIGEFVK